MNDLNDFDDQKERNDKAIIFKLIICSTCDKPVLISQAKYSAKITILLKNLFHYKNKIL